MHGRYKRTFYRGNSIVAIMQKYLKKGFVPICKQMGTERNTLSEGDGFHFEVKGYGESIIR
jgi:hypothetical protein